MTPPAPVSFVLSLCLLLSALATAQEANEEESFDWEDVESWGLEEEQAPEGPVEELWRHLRDHVTVELSTWGAYYREDGEPENDRGFLEGRALLEYRADLGSWGRIVVEPRLVYDTEEFSEGFTPTVDERPELRRIFDFDTASFSLLWGDFELTVGKRRYLWGSADFFHPVRFFDARDYTDPLRQPYLGVPGVEARYTLGVATLSVVVASSFTPARTLPFDSRWFPAEQLEFGGGGIQPEDLPFDRELPARIFENVQPAVRLSFELTEIDFSFVFFQGFQSLPRVETEPPPPSSEPLPPRFVATYPEYRAVGADFSTELWDFEIHGEIAHRFYRSNEASSFLRAVLGLNRRLPGIDPPHELMALLEYAHTFVTDEEDEPLLPRYLDYAVQLEEALAAALVYRYREPAEIEARLGVVTALSERSNAYVSASFKWVMAEGLEVSVGLDALFGHSDSLIGGYRDNDRAWLELSYTF